MWGDKYKDELLFVHQGTGHNKFWTIIYDTATKIVTRRWGRIGTKGQSKSEPAFAADYTAARFIETKIAGQKREGYKQVDRSTLDRMAIEAAIVGTQNKCHNFRWVELHHDSHGIGMHGFSPISEERLMDPSCNPGLVVDIETKKAYGGKTRFTLLFTLEQAYEIRQPQNLTPITKSDPLYSLTGKVEEAVGRSMSG